MENNTVKKIMSNFQDCGCCNARIYLGFMLSYTKVKVTHKGFNCLHYQTATLTCRHKITLHGDI